MQCTQWVVIPFGKRCRRAWWLALISLPSLAQDPVPALTLRQAMDQALAANGLLEAGKERIAAAAGLRQQALTGPNPKLIFQTENTRPSEFRFFRDTDDFLYLQHTLETGGRRLKRGDVAGAVETRLTSEAGMLAFDIRSRVKRAYWSAAGAQRTQRWLETNLARFGEIVRYHEIRMREGAIAEADLLRVQLEQSKLRVALSNAQLVADRTRIELFREMSATSFPEVDFEWAEEPLAAPAGDAAEAIARRPDVAAAQALMAQARSNVSLQTAIAKPNVDAVFGMKRVAGSVGTPSYTTLMAGLQVDLPFFNKNQGNIVASQAEVRATDALLASVKARVSAEVEAARRAVTIRSDELARIIAPLRAQAEEGASIAQAAYRIGGVDLLRLIDSERARIDAQLTYYQSLTDYHQSVAALEVALGLP
jgi:outer membrane protein, heavy metal efflux system